MIITAKHYGTHLCPVEVKGRSKDVSKISKGFPHLTRESMVRQKVQQQLEQSSFSAAVTSAQKTIPTKHILIISREKKRRRGDQTGVVSRL